MVISRVVENSLKCAFATLLCLFVCGCSASQQNQPASTSSQETESVFSSLDSDSSDEKSNSAAGETSSSMAVASPVGAQVELSGLPSERTGGFEDGEYGFKKAGADECAVGYAGSISAIWDAPNISSGVAYPDTPESSGEHSCSVHFGKVDESEYGQTSSDQAEDSNVFTLSPGKVAEGILLSNFDLGVEALEVSKAERRTVGQWDMCHVQGMLRCTDYWGDPVENGELLFEGYSLTADAEQDGGSHGPILWFVVVDDPVNSVGSDVLGDVAEKTAQSLRFA